MSGSLRLLDRAKRAGAIVRNRIEPPKIRALVVDDQFLPRAGLTCSINTETDMMLVAEATAGADAITQLD